MARGKALERTLEQLSLIRNDPSAPDAVTTLRKILADRSSHAVTKAAEIVAENEMEALVADLVAAFERFLSEPVKGDPGCGAKTAIADALYRIGAREPGVYLKGIRHVQMEPVWGGRADTAASLRGTCALALVRTNYPDYLTELADLLADAEAPVRRMAAQALAYSENRDAVPLLRLKALTGDAEAQVSGECLLALLRIAPGASLDFVARFLDSGEAEVAESAALALGASRLAEAFPVLKEWWESTFHPTLRRAALLAIAMLKRDEAVEYLLSFVAEGPAVHARDAVEALAVYRHDPRLRTQVEEALQSRKDKSLRRVFEEAFGDVGKDEV